MLYLLVKPDEQFQKLAILMWGQIKVDEVSSQTTDIRSLLTVLRAT